MAGHANEGAPASEADKTRDSLSLCGRFDVLVLCVDNAAVARMLATIGDILELTGGNPFKVRAYRQAAQVVDLLPRPVAELWREGTLAQLPAIGAHTAQRIGEILERGSCEEYDRLAASVPPGVLEMLELEGVGPKTVGAIWRQLGIVDLEGLEAACRSGKLRDLPRMGPKRVQAILEAIERHRRRKGRTPLHRAVSLADGLVARLRELPEVIRAEVAGSVRRRVETVGDVDLLVASRDPEPVMRRFVSLPEVETVLSHGITKSSVRVRSGLQVDLRVLPPESFGAALHYFTGSKAHNIALRTLAVRKKVKLSEYGVFDREGRRLGGEREEDVFAAVGLPWIPPELREGAGEIEAAAEGRLPKLVEEEDVIGDLHVHSDASSDGRSSLAELAAEARRLGRRYLAVTDHSRSRPLGLDAGRLREQARAIAAANAERSGRPRLLRGVEVDILPDGSLDLPAEVLAELEWVVASVHSHFDDSRDKMTERMIRAIESGVVDAIGHPSGRILGRREPYAYDLARVLEAAREHDVALEINAMPERLDLDDKAARLAKDARVAIVISSDSHVASHLANLRYGVWVARRGWLETEDILNTRPLRELAARRRRRAATRSHYGNHGSTGRHAP